MQVAEKSINKQSMGEFSFASFFILGAFALKYFDCLLN